MSHAGYVPGRSDIAWIDFDPSVGCEQAKRRPALVFSDRSYNKISGLCLACPIRSRSKGWPYDVQIAFGKINGFIMADQLQSMDWRLRRIDYIATLPLDTFEEARARLLTLIE